MSQAIAKLNYLKMAPRKVRLIASTIRGMGVSEAEAQLMFRARRAAGPVLTLLRSCVANAKNLKMDPARLFVSKITVDQGPVMKRSLPRAQGRATPILKKMSHVVIILEEGVKAFPQRFVVTKPVRVKKEVKKPKTKKSVAGAGAAHVEKPKESTGFFKRIFRRKSV